MSHIWFVEMRKLNTNYEDWKVYYFFPTRDSARLYCRAKRAISHIPSRSSNYEYRVRKYVRVEE